MQLVFKLVTLEQDLQRESLANGDRGVPLRVYLSPGVVTGLRDAKAHGNGSVFQNPNPGNQANVTDVQKWNSSHKDQKIGILCGQGYFGSQGAVKNVFHEHGFRTQRMRVAK